MSLFQECVEQVDDALRCHVAFGRVEDEIEAMPLEPDQRNALWLHAWAEQPRETRVSLMLPEFAHID